MMITQNELNISNKSYTNKDFQTIFPEILEIAKSLSRRWDPSSTNESDPGIVLLKLCAFIADKNDYNIDKNILEAFMPSATQEASMRKLCDMNGYSMKSYISATTQATIVYTGDALTNNKLFRLPKYTTTLSDINNSIIYTLLDTVIVEQSNYRYTVNVIEGKVTQLIVGDTDIIQLNNLDDNNRLYLPIQNVAENGIFVYNANDEESTDWIRVDNLNIQASQQKVFKFGYDSDRNLPYIQFPDDIATIIDSGLKIWYTSSSGVNGNISANVLSQVSSNTTIQLEGVLTGENETIDIGTKDDGTSVLTINNVSSSTNGADPETIDEAYNNFKKVVGTFDTLVTCRDYANAIYNLISTSTLKNAVSNCQVSDRRNDINFSNNYITLSRDGIFKTSASNYKDITPFDILIYALNPITGDYNVSSYNQSYQPLSYLNMLEVTTLLENEQTISHSFVDIINDYNQEYNGKLFLIKNMYTLNGKIATKSKVNNIERQSIINNVKTALMKNFNARMVDYGYEIPYDSLVNVIESADSRIKLVSLDEPILKTYVLVKNQDASSNTQYSVVKDFTKAIGDGDLKTNYYLDIAAKNILEGKINLFEKDDRFTYSFGQSLLQGNSTPIISNLSSVTTLANISLQPDSWYTLRDNECIQLVTPNLVTQLVYPYGINYLFTSNTPSIAANTEYQLVGSDTLQINYTDSNDVEQNITYRAGDIIKPNFELTQGSPALGGIEINGVRYNQLSSNQTIEKRVIATNTIKYNGVEPEQLLCFWIRNNPNNELFTENDKINNEGVISYKTILQSDEYFIYTNSAKNELVILGSGTQLEAQALDSTHTVNMSWSNSSTLTIQDITNNGLSAFDDVDWKYINFTKFIVTEMQILTLTTGDKIRSSSAFTLNNDFQGINNAKISYILSANPSSEVQLTTYNIPEINWKIKSRLDILAGLGVTQSLLSNQSVEFKYKSDSGSIETYSTITGSDTESPCITFSNYVNIAGGKDIQLTVNYINDNGLIEQRYDLACYLFTASTITYNGVDFLGTLNSQDLYNVELKAGTSLSLPAIAIKDTTQLFSFYYSKISADANEKITLSCDGEKTLIRLFAGGQSSSAYANSLAFDKAGLYTIQIDTSANSNLTLTFNPGTTVNNSSLLISKMLISNGLNPVLDITSDDDKKYLLSKIATLSSGNFYYNYSVDNSDNIDVDSLSAPSALWNTNNVANRITLAQIDFDTFNIDILKSSQL